MVRHRNRHCLLVSSVAGSIKFVFKALGWLFAEGGDKTPDFSHSVSVLGVQIDVHVVLSPLTTQTVAKGTCSRLSIHLVQEAGSPRCFETTWKAAVCCRSGGRSACQEVPQCGYQACL